MPETISRPIVDLDYHSPEFRNDPYGTFRRMRESGCPVGWTQAHFAFLQH